MKLIIDENQCFKHHLTLEETLLALAIRKINNLTETLKLLENREVIVLKDNQYIVTQHWSDELDELICNSIQAVDNEERLDNLALQMQNLYPAGKMPNSSYYYRCNKAEVKRKLKKFFITFGNYSDKEILEATQRFLNSFHGDYTYLPLIKYFILKNKPVLGEDGIAHAELQSPLATYLENKEESTVDSDDWLSTIKN